MADDFASAFILASSSRVMREPGSLAGAARREREKTDTKQEHKALSHMTSDPTTATVGTRAVHDPYVKGGGARPRS